MADSSTIWAIYRQWFLQGGRKVEKQMAAKFAELSEGTELSMFAKSRFQDTVYKGFQLFEDAEDNSLLDMCTHAITAVGEFNAQDFIAVQRVIRHGSLPGTFDVSKEEALAAAERLNLNPSIVLKLLEEQ